MISLRKANQTISSLGYTVCHLYTKWAVFFKEIIEKKKYVVLIFHEINDSQLAKLKINIFNSLFRTSKVKTDQPNFPLLHIWREKLKDQLKFTEIVNLISLV